MKKLHYVLGALGIIILIPTIMMDTKGLLTSDQSLIMSGVASGLLMVSAGLTLRSKEG